jgi:hypothetical protein
VFLVNSLQIEEHLASQGLPCPRRAVAIWVASFLLMCGIGNSSALAKCGSSSGGSAWKYRNTVELTTWDGRWWSNEQSPLEMQESAHPPDESEPCSHCGGRPAEEGPPQTPFLPAKTNDSSAVFQCDASLIDRDAPPLDAIAFVTEVVPSREMDVAERPPKASS